MKDVGVTCVFDAVEALSLSFASENHPEKPPSMVEYLGKVREGMQTPLLRNLLQIDIERRRLKGEQPQIEDYLQWFPEHESLIRHEFLESTVASRYVLSKDAPVSNVSLEIRTPMARRLGEYHLIRELGRGGMGAVFEAVHSRRQDRLALKVLPEVDGKRLHLFKREFRSLADVNHPNLVGLHTLECDGDQWFFTMDLVDGTDFLSYVRPNGRLDEKRLRAALAQLSIAVMALHANFTVHRDLKPSNVMVDQGGRVVLLDFGLIFDLETAAATQTSDVVIGTPAYMSPEQASGKAVTAACDWYAVGTMLYQALTGRLPFSGTLLQILQAKREKDPPPLEERNGLPADLCDLSLRLLARQAEERPDALAIAGAVAIDPNNISDPSATRHPLVGREDQLRELSEMLKTFVQSETPVTAFISGHSGEGKTALCEAFLEPLKSDTRFAVMSGRCYDRETVPFKALDNSIDAICGYLNRLPAAEIAATFPRDAGMLAYVLPVFGRVQGVAAAPIQQVRKLDDQEVKSLAFLALRELLGRISDRQPVILFIDDLQWGDAESARILMQILQPPNAPRLFLLGTYRTDEAGDSRFLNTWEEAKSQHAVEIERRDVPVGPLTREEVRKLVVELLHQDSETIRKRSEEFFEQTRGNAFLLIQLVGCFDPHTDSFRPIPLAEVIEEKLGRLQPEARRLLEVVVVAGHGMAIQEASAVAGYDSTPTATLIRMRSERLLRFLGSETDRELDTYHDRIRESMLASMEPEIKRSLHQEIGEYIEGTSGGLDDQQLQALEQEKYDPSQGDSFPRLFDLARHFEQAGCERKACGYSLLAAEQARRQFALEIAASHYEVARRNSEHWTASLRYRINFGLGDTLLLLGRFREAEQRLRDAQRQTEDLLDRCDVECSLVELARGEGRYADSAEQCGATLRSLGLRVPGSRTGLVIGILKEAATHWFRSLIHRSAKEKTPADRLQTLRSRALIGYTAAIWFRNTPSIIWSTLTSLNRLEGFAPSKEQITSRCQHGLVMCVMGIRSRGFYYFDLARAGVDDDDLGTQLVVGFYRAVGFYVLCEYENCRAEARSTLKLVPRTGNIWMSMVLRLHLILSTYRLGELSDALRDALDAFQASVRLGDPNTAHDYVNLVAMLTGGGFDFPAMKASLVSTPDNFQATNQVLQAEARWHLYHGRPAEAVELAQKALDLIKRHVVINHITSPTFPLLLKAIRLHSERLHQSAPAEAQKLLKRGKRLAGWAVRFTRNSPDYPETLREAALYQALGGKLKKAIKLAAQSLRVALATDAACEAAQSRLTLVQFRYRLGLVSAGEVEREQEAVDLFSAGIEQLRSEHPLLRS